MFNLTFNLIDLMLVSTVYGVETRSKKLTSERSKNKTSDEFGLPLGTDVRCDITVRKSINSTSKNDHSLIFLVDKSTNKMQLDFVVDWKLSKDQIDQDGNMLKKGTKLTFKDADILISNNEAMLFVCFPDVNNSLAKKFNISTSTPVAVGFEGENFLYSVENGQYLVGFENIDECAMYSYNSKKRQLEETSVLSTKRLEIEDSWMKQNMKEGHPFKGELQTKKPFCLVHYEDIKTLLKGKVESVKYSINAVLANTSNIVTAEGVVNKVPITERNTNRKNKHELYTLTKKVLVKLTKNILEHKKPVERNIYTKFDSMCSFAKYCLRENPMHKEDKERMEYNIKVIEELQSDIFRHLLGSYSKDRRERERREKEEMEKNLREFREFKEKIKRELKEGIEERERGESELKEFNENEIKLRREREQENSEFKEFREQEEMENRLNREREERENRLNREREERENRLNREREVREEREEREMETPKRSLDIFVENQSEIDQTQHNIGEFDTIPFVSGDNVNVNEVNVNNVDEVNTESREEIPKPETTKSDRKVVKDKKVKDKEQTIDYKINQTSEKDNSVRNISEKDESEIELNEVSTVDESEKKSKSLKIALIVLGVLALIAVLLVGWTYYSKTKKVCTKEIFEDQSP